MASSLFSALSVAFSGSFFANAAPYYIPVAAIPSRVEIQSHRGGTGLLGLQESLLAFAFALETGADTLEMDLLFSKDGVPVIWHDHNIPEAKCTGPYVGQFVANLTLSQLKELDCASRIDGHPQAARIRIATFEEVLDLITCYGDQNVEINLETKLDPRFPHETWPAQKYIDEVVPILQRYGLDNRTTLQSFDWSTIIGIKSRWPYIRTAALVEDTTIAPSAAGEYLWLGNITLDTTFNHDWVAAAASIGASILSPAHGMPSDAMHATPGYQDFTTKETIDRAHSLGMKVAPWTVDHEPTINRLIDLGVDTIISNDPERVMWVGSQRGLDMTRTKRPRKHECLMKAEILATA